MGPKIKRIPWFSKPQVPASHMLARHRGPVFPTLWLGRSRPGMRRRTRNISWQSCCCAVTLCQLPLLRGTLDAVPACALTDLGDDAWALSSYLAWQDSCRILAEQMPRRNNRLRVLQPSVPRTVAWTVQARSTKSVPNASHTVVVWPGEMKGEMVDKESKTWITA